MVLTRFVVALHFFVGRRATFLRFHIGVEQRALVFRWQAQHFRHLRSGDADALFRRFLLFVGRRATFRSFFRVSHLRALLFRRFVLAGAVLSPPRIW